MEFLSEGRRGLGVVLGMSLGIQASVGHAQDDPDGSGSTLLGRIIFGAGHDKVAIDTPQAVTVVDQEDLDAEQPTTIGDALTDIPGVKAIGSDRILGETFNIRGVGKGEAAGDEGRIIITVDGATKFYEQYRMGSFFSEPELYKQIEVLRGPASSTLYGSGALGGVINLTTKDASDYLGEDGTWAIRTKGAYDSNGNGTLASLTAARRIGEAFEVLANGNWRRSDAFNDGDGDTIPSSEFDAFSGLLKGTYRFGDGDEQVLRASYEHWVSDANDQDYSQIVTLPAFGTVDRKVTDQTAVLAYENPASDNPWLDLDVTASFSDTLVEQSNASFAGFDPLFADTEYSYQTWQFNVENTIGAKRETYENYLTFGVQNAYQIRTADNAETPLGHHPGGNDFQIGFFVQDEFIWNERLTLIPGIRIDYQRLEADDGVIGGETVEDFAYSPKLAALYKINDTLSVFGSYAHTERFPTLDEIYSSDLGGADISLNLEKERSDNVEGGIALSLTDLVSDGDILQLKTTGFYNRVNNLIERQRFSVPQYVNVGEAEYYGIEVEGAYEAERFFGRLAYTMIRGNDLTTGEPLDTIPADELALTLGGRLPMYNIEFGWRGVFANRQYRVPPGDMPTDGYVVHDIFASWLPQDGPAAGLEARFSIDNLFDRQYREHLSNDPAKGRTFKLTLARTFGG